MIYSSLFLLIFAGVTIFSIPAFAQDGPPPGDVRPDVKRENDDRRPNLLAELGLAPEQVDQIRRFNQERRPQLQEARRRVGEAQRNLDMAIYGDALVSEADFQVRLREFQAAEQELSRLRFEGELAVRKVLTPEQLVRFRELRRRFADTRRERGNQRRFLRRNNQIEQGQPPLDRKPPPPQTRPVKRSIS